MEILKNIPVQLDPDEIMKRLHFESRGDWSQIQAIIEMAQQLIRARAGYKVCFIEDSRCNNDRGNTTDEQGLEKEVG
jgi:hypothetical protein